MATVTKINVGKNEEATAVVEQLIDAEGDEVLVVIPKNSRFTEAGTNFRLLKREADVLKKKLRIESVDDAALALATEYKIQNSNPFFGKPSRKVSDIIPRRAKREEVKEVVTDEIKKEDEEDGEGEIKKEFAPRRTFFGKGVKIALVVLILLGVAAFTLGSFLKKADIALIRATTPWTFTQVVKVSPTIFAVDSVKKEIPGQTFSERKNISLEFPATGKRTGMQKASGTITIHNAYSATAQPLVASTRFVTPDGKVFRLNATIVVPGAKIEGGKLIPSSIDAQVTADRTGVDYNIPAVAKFTIPGFVGTPKAGKIYAESTQPMAGAGSSGDAYPTDAEIKAAKEMSAKTLTDTLRMLVITQIPKEFTALDNAQAIRIEKQTVDTTGSSPGKFSVYTEGVASLVVYKESDLRVMIEGAMKAEKGSEFEVKDATLSITKDAVTRNADTLAIPVEYKGTLAKAIDLTSFKQQIAGRSEQELKKIIFSLPGLASAKIALWPFWVKVVPDPDRVKVTIN